MYPQASIMLLLAILALGSWSTINAQAIIIKYEDGEEAQKNFLDTLIAHSRNREAISGNEVIMETLSNITAEQAKMNAEYARDLRNVEAHCGNLIQELLSRVNISCRNDRRIEMLEEQVRTLQANSIPGSSVSNSAGIKI